MFYYFPLVFFCRRFFLFNKYMPIIPILKSNEYVSKIICYKMLISGGNITFSPPINYKYQCKSKYYKFAMKTTTNINKILNLMDSRVVTLGFRCGWRHIYFSLIECSRDLCWVGVFSFGKEHTLYRFDCKEKIELLDIISF